MIEVKQGIIAVIYLLGFFWSNPLFCQPGYPDPTFGEQGRTVFDVDNDFLYDIIIGRDGSIYTGGFAGSSSGAPGKVMVLSKLLANGQLDKSFGKNGIIAESDYAKNTELATLVTDKNDRILIGVNQQNEAIISRLHKNGRPDSSFASQGSLSLPLERQIILTIHKLFITQDQSIILTGLAKPDSYVLKLTPNGKIDSSFAEHGLYKLAVGEQSDYSYGLHVENNGKILICGNSQISSRVWDVFVLRLNPGGHPDSTFGVNGLKKFGLTDGWNQGSQVVVLSGGEVLVCGSLEKNRINIPTLFLLTPQGAFVSSFGINGILTFNQLLSSRFEDVEILSEKVIIAGGGRNLVSINQSGSLNVEFGKNGIAKQEMDIYGLALDEQGKLLACGDIIRDLDRKFAVSRINTQSTTALNHGNNLSGEIKIIPNPAFDQIRLGGKADEQAEIEIINVTGLVVLKSSQVEVNISHLSQGIYFLRYQNRVKKFLKM